MTGKITPWEVTGKVNYEKIIKEFGVSPITPKLKERLARHAKKKNKPLHHLIRRNIFFCHRNLDTLLNEYEKGKPFFLYTGRAPSGHTHLGHLISWILAKWLQDVFDAELWFQFPDDEKFLFKEDLTLEETATFTKENMLDVIALGFNPKKTHFLINTLHAGILYKEAIKVAKRITFSTAKAAFGFRNDTNIGAIFYTSMQAVPAFLPSVLKKKTLNCLIPHGVDQDPHFRLTRDVIGKLGYPKPASIQCVFLPPLSGTGGKMGTSTADAPFNTIFTTDSPSTIKKKINKYAFSGGQATVEEHRKRGGNTDVDVSYQYLRYFEEDDQQLERIKRDYESGKLLTGELKAILIEKLSAFLTKHQENREKARQLTSKFLFRQHT
ncbi:tryptophan--tRNA ligase [Candidatus Woesearchaeota archaeon]|nr:MAG: tryptophan--tRNA ligase [Candidatus Woesearchaeota archaeon]